MVTGHNMVINHPRYMNHYQRLIITLSVLSTIMICENTRHLSRPIKCDLGEPSPALHRPKHYMRTVSHNQSSNAVYVSPTVYMPVVAFLRTCAPATIKCSQWTLIYSKHADTSLQQMIYVGFCVKFVTITMYLAISTKKGKSVPDGRAVSPAILTGGNADSQKHVSGNPDCPWPHETLNLDFCMFQTSAQKDRYKWLLGPSTRTMTTMVEVDDVYIWRRRPLPGLDVTGTHTVRDPSISNHSNDQMIYVSLLCSFQTLLECETERDDITSWLTSYDADPPPPPPSRCAPKSRVHTPCHRTTEVTRCRVDRRPNHYYYEDGDAPVTSPRHSILYMSSMINCIHVLLDVILSCTSVFKYKWFDYVSPVNIDITLDL